MTIVAETQKSVNWLSQLITDNGMVKVAAIGAIVLLVLIFLALKLRWVVFPAEGEIYKGQVETYRSQVDNLTAVLAAMDTRDLGKIKDMLDDIGDEVKEIKRDQGAIKDELRDLRGQGGGRSG